MTRPNTIVLATLAGLAVISVAVLLLLQARLTFIADDWRFLLQRRGFGLDTFLNVHNDHIVILPVAVYKVLLAGFGMRSALPYQVAATCVFIASAVLLFTYARRRLGDWPALLLSALVLFLGAAWNDLLWSFQIGFSASMAAGIGAVLAFQRDGRRTDVLAMVLLVIATSSSELGVSFDLGVLTAVALSDRRWSRRLLVPVVPLALYGLWYLGWGHSGVHAATLHNLVRSPKFAFDLLSENLASLLGLATPVSGSGAHLVGLVWGQTLLLGTLALIVRRRRAINWRCRELWTVVVAGASFWFLTALNALPGLREPTSGRYQYPGALFALLIAAELLAGARLGRRFLVVSTAVTLAAAVSGLIYLHKGYRVIKGETDLERATLAAAELGRRHEAAGYEIPFDIFTRIPARTYFAAVQTYGSPAFTERQLVAAPELDRAAADATLIAAEGIKLQAPIGGGRAAVCAQQIASGAPIALSPGRYAVRNRSGRGLDVTLGRFAGAPTVDIGPVPPASTASLDLPSDASRRPWRLTSNGSGALSLCQTRGQPPKG